MYACNRSRWPKPVSERFNTIYNNICITHTHIHTYTLYIIVIIYTYTCALVVHLRGWPTDTSCNEKSEKKGLAGHDDNSIQFVRKTAQQRIGTCVLCTHAPKSQRFNVHMHTWRIGMYIILWVHDGDFAIAHRRRLPCAVVRLRKS